MSAKRGNIRDLDWISRSQLSPGGTIMTRLWKLGDDQTLWHPSHPRISLEIDPSIDSLLSPQARQTAHRKYIATPCTHHIICTNLAFGPSHHMICTDPSQILLDLQYITQLPCNFRQKAATLLDNKRGIQKKKKGYGKIKRKGMMGCVGAMA